MSCSGPDDTKIFGFLDRCINLPVHSFLDAPSETHDCQQKSQHTLKRAVACAKKNDEDSPTMAMTTTGMIVYQT